MAEMQKQVELEIAHVLFIDIVGYSKLTLDQQRAAVEELNAVVRASEQFQKSEGERQFLRLATGDGVALIFPNSPQAPVQCAVEVARGLKPRPYLLVRMGVHSGPVSGVVDLTGSPNVTGAGINVAQRVMSCGDAGHILLSKHAAEDLAEFARWRPRLHEVGAAEVKHGTRIDLVNLHDDEIGNPAVPTKLRTAQQRKWRGRTAIAVSILILLGIASWVIVHRRPVAGELPQKSIAILPFENLSAEKQNQYFADGVQDQILTDLAQIADLKVISRTSVMGYRHPDGRNLRKIGEELGVVNVVEGSVQRAGNRVRVNAQLIDAGKDRHLWGQTYDRDLADVFAIQSEIAKAIADQLQAKLSPNEKAAIERPPTSDLAAFDLYTRAKPIPHSHAFGAGTKDRLLQAADLLNQAIARDPNFVSAYCVLGYVHDQLYFLNFDHTPARIALAQSAVETALRLQPGAGEAHLARADYLYRCFLDYEGARTEIAIARRTLSNDPTVFELLAYIDRRQGRWEDSAQNFEHSIALDPRNYFILQQAALSYQSLRQYRKMAAALDRALEIVPNDSDTRIGRASIDLDWRGDTKPMHSTIEEIGSQNPSDLSEIADQWVTLALCERDFAAADRALTSLGDNVFGEDAVSFRGAFAEGLLARMKGDDAAAHAAFSKARVEQEEKVHAHPDYGPNLCALALIDAGLGRKEDALREGQRAIELLPVEKDFINGVHMIEFYAITCAWVGEKDLALKYLASAVQLPGTLSYGQLKLMPWWDPLRGDPRFEKIVASLAPKEK
jgi:TolB-like protein/class 3 adenylate cyclase